MIISALSLSMQAQTSPVDDLFDRYDGKEGFTSVYISSKMFSLLSRIDSDDEEFRNLVTRIKGIRILSIDSAENAGRVNFVSELMPRLRRNGLFACMTARS